MSKRSAYKNLYLNIFDRGSTQERLRPNSLEVSIRPFGLHSLHAFKTIEIQKTRILVAIGIMLRMQTRSIGI